MLSTARAGLSLAQLVCANSAAHHQSLIYQVCSEDLHASFFASISPTAFEALDITYFTAFSSLFPAEGPGDMAEVILLSRIVATKGFTTFT